MSVNADNLRSAVCYALQTTRATAVCPFHPDVMIRVGDDAAENYAYARARKIIKSDGTMWGREVLMEEFKRLLADAVDGECPQCAAHSALSGAPLRNGTVARQH